MVPFDAFRKKALSFPEATEEKHFEKISFRIRKKIFATYDGGLERACLKLSEIDQDVFSSVNRNIIYPVDNQWGKQGWTLIEMEKIPTEIFMDALSHAYCEVAPKKLADLVRAGLTNEENNLD